jgi:hypothetical protein
MRSTQSSVAHTSEALDEACRLRSNPAEVAAALDAREVVTAAELRLAAVTPARETQVTVIVCVEIGPAPCPGNADPVPLNITCVTV